ncbi:MAG: hypothetical protein A3J66_00215 [Candidatus Magasanikbacteria bacterium RIFCSPHIGHO2_02_FULL_47_14]|uniref:ABC transporter permease n=1 Tax=Candidatus Magasanikbacteria bacterium RIFCSPHIGHO2_02_FULL_47_14 TaxID=1798680 RepID=A0A1F6MA93_9BACT|nr:MAG: hypothetical protein A3J66_00215 [Candidatus Magasanikbacteria bacterium RIFCSPHIGHO2_02_FULL_47_14]
MTYKKYLRIYSIFLKNAISYEAQYRKDTWIRLCFSVLWMGMTFLFVEVLFTHTESIGGWTKEHLYTLTFFWIFVDELTVTLFQKTTEIPSLVTDGTLDFYFTKPVSALFLVTTERISVRGVWRLVIELALFVFFWAHFDFSPTATQAGLAILLLLAGLVVSYSVRLLLNTLSFWFYRIDNINDLWISFSDAGKYPLHILPKTLRILFLSFVPVAFSAYIPASAFFGLVAWYGVAYAFLFSAFIFLASLLLWNVAVKRYTSASS